MSQRYVGLDYLRALLIVRLVAFHSVFAYVDFGKLVPPDVMPIVDSQRWSGFAVFVQLNETFSMSLMYFISGLFVWSGLARRGALGYALARGRRLGIPFALVIILVMPLAYYPVYLSRGFNLGVAAYAEALFSSRIWEAGPLWFVWLLLVFDLCAAAIYAVAPKAMEALGRVTAGAVRRPARCFILFVACAGIVYLPMVAAFGPWRWAVLGPFALQPSRLLHYAFYFFAGVGIGAFGLSRGPLAEGSALVRHWARWTVVAVLLNVFYLGPLFPLVVMLSRESPLLGLLLFGLGFAATSAATPVGRGAIFQRFLTRHVGVADSLAANSYGIYLGHYPFVLWMQYMLLGVPLPVGIKALIVFVCALAPSWGVAALFRAVLRAARAPAPQPAASPAPGAQ